MMEPRKAEQGSDHAQEQDDNECEHRQCSFERKEAAKEWPTLKVLLEIIDHLVASLLQLLLPILQGILHRQGIQRIFLVILLEAGDGGSNCPQLCSGARHRASCTGKEFWVSK